MSERQLLTLLKDANSLTSAEEVRLATRKLLKEAGLRLPMPGEGKTLLRWQMLAELGAHDLSMAKLAESHFDALAILHEAGVSARPGIYGVWASKFGGRCLKGEFNEASKSWKIEGDLAFASGFSLIDHALVPVSTDRGEILFQIPRSAVNVVSREWETPGMKDADTAVVHVELTLNEQEAVGEPGFYLNRPGFWAGAIGVAASWLGAAQRLYGDWQRLAQKRGRSDPHEEAARAESFCQLKACSELMKSAAKLVDDKKVDSQRLQREAQMIRHLVDQAANSLLAKATRTMGPMLMVGHAGFSRRALDLQIFTRQCHAEKDLVQLAQVLAPCFQETPTHPYEREVWFE